MTSGERERRWRDIKDFGSAAVAVSAVFVGIAVGGCSSGKVTSHDAGDSAVVGDPVDDFLPAVRNAICERAVACLQQPDVATCLATRIVSDGFGIPAWVSSVKRGGASFDPAAAAACLDAIPRECFVIDPEWQLTQWLGRYMQTPPCLAAFVGTVQPNQRCESTIECENKHCGGGSPCPGGGAIGACRPGPDFQAPGATCDGSESLCEFDATCGPDGICLGLLPAGSQCGNGSQACARGTSCVSADGMAPYFCVTAPVTGEACDASGRCGRIDDYCNATTNVCTRLGKPGESCVLDNDCVIYASCGNFVCKSKGKIGDACDNNLHPCIPDLPCVGGVCQAAPLTTCP